MKKFAVPALVIAASLGLAACSQETKQEASEATNAAIEDVTEVADDAANAATNAADATANAVDNAADATANATANTMDAAGDKLKEGAAEVKK